MLGVNIAIFDEQGRILLTKREDFEVWCLPGGGVDEGEAPYPAAIREVQEETGLMVRPISLVGVYSVTSWFEGVLHLITFTAEVIGGEWKPDPHEVVDMRWFHRHELPQDMLVGQSERIRDAFDGVVGKLQSENRQQNIPMGISRKELYRLRDESGLSRVEFYYKMFNELTPEHIQVHLQGIQLNKKD
jgi:ADP-ribose pyrophosphatase YjhB (NUDIX family)